jgi:DNA-directed RNA polymerase subunit RPC12/RpoP
MSETTVYGCDWCKEIVPRQRTGDPGFTARITVELLYPGPPMGQKPTTYDICADCKKALTALTEGKFRR